jgi:DUF438 domain-containing protein
MFNNLSREQLEGILDALPMEFIFVDANNCLQYGNKGERRSRKAPEGVIGKDIHGCHKKESHPRVDELIENLRSGKKDEDEFWVSYEQKILNRFLAVRGKNGEFLGIIEYLLDFNAVEKIAEEKKDAYKLFP